MTRTERSRFRAHCKAEADAFDAKDTPVTRALRKARESQARNLRRVRRMIIGVAILAAYIGYQMLKELLR